MKQPTNNKNLSDKEERNMENANIEKTLYPPKEDIYNQNKNEENIDPQDISRNKDLNADIKAGKDLDVPGAELDDDNEDTGNEDEENNYYSIGGDDHNDLDEDKDE